MTLEAQQAECPLAVTVETSAGQSVIVPFASLTREQVATFLQVDFKRLVQQVGLKGARVHVQHAQTVGYNKLLEETEAYLRRAAIKAASRAAA
jgi:hypothetical protein